MLRLRLPIMGLMMLCMCAAMAMGQQGTPAPPCAPPQDDDWLIEFLGVDPAEQLIPDPFTFDPASPTLTATIKGGGLVPDIQSATAHSDAYAAAQATLTAQNYSISNNSGGASYHKFTQRTTTNADGTTSQYVWWAVRGVRAHDADGQVIPGEEVTTTVTDIHGDQNNWKIERSTMRFVTFNHEPTAAEWQAYVDGQIGTYINGGDRIIDIVTSGNTCPGNNTGPTIYYWRIIAIDQGAPAPAILLGDVNMDGNVNFLDIQPYIDALTDGLYIAEADMNQDGVLSFLDTPLFTAALNN